MELFQLKKNVRSSRIGTIIKVLALAIGIFLMQIYILGLRYYESEIFPTVVFLGGASLVTLSLTLLWDSRGHRQKPLLLIALVFIVAFNLIKIPTLRFTFIPGSDLLGEYYAAEKTSTSQKWPPDLPILPSSWLAGRGLYLWTTSVTLLPSIISHITGLPVIHIFEVMLPLISAIVPVLIFLFTRQAFNTRVATLSSVIFILSPIYIAFFNLTKENLALISFLLSLLCVLKSVRHKDSRFGFLALIFAFTTVTFHYVLGDFAILTSLVFLLSPKLHKVFKKIGTHDHLRRFFQTEWNPVVIVRPTMFLFVVVSVFAWFSLASPILSKHIRIASNTVEGLTGVVAPQRHYMVSHTWISPLGLYHTMISNLIKLLIAVGFFIALKTSNTTEKFNLTLLGGTVLTILVGWMIIPRISFGLFIDRVYGIGFWIFSTFIALALVTLSSKLPRWKSLMPLFLLTIIFFEAILTMPSIYWHAKGSLDAEDILMVPHRGSSLITLGTWINQNVEKQNALLADAFVMDVKIFAEIQVSKMDTIFRFFNASDPKTFAISANYRYLVASSWMLEGYISFKGKTTGERVVWTLDEEKIQQLYDDFNVLYCNGNYSLFYPPSEEK